MNNPDDSLISPYGGHLVDLLTRGDEIHALWQEAVYLPSISLTARSMLDLELLSVGAFSPLSTFMGKSDYESVRDHMRLADGLCFPIPITLHIDSPKSVKEGQRVVLKSPTNECVAILLVDEIFPWDWKKEAREVFETTSLDHPVVSEMQQWGRFCISGPLRLLRLPPHEDFPLLYGTPQEVRARLKQLGRSSVVAFQTRNPLHSGHEAMIAMAIAQTSGTLLFHPVTGITNVGDVDGITRIRTYQWMVDHVFDRRRVLFQLTPLAMRMAGPREAVWHAIIRRNYGASRLIVGRDHASPGRDRTGKLFYSPFAAQKLATQYAPKTGVAIVPFDELVYVPSLGQYEQRRTLVRGSVYRRISATKVRASSRFPSWSIRPEIARILIDTNRLPKKGFCIWFTGLPASGKSTIAMLFAARLRYQGYQVTRLDGDAVRQKHHYDLGFSKADRDRQVLRVGRMAKDIVDRGEIAICSLVSPYEGARRRVSNLIGKEQFILLYVATPLGVCERRDTKLLYLRARVGRIRRVTGIDDPYEVPRRPALRLSTTQTSPQRNVATILAYLKKHGFFQTTHEDP